MNNMKKISFFSYKGGAGRTSTAFNTLPYLVRELHPTKEHPILIVDLDIDSAGMTFLIKELLNGKNRDVESYSVQDAINGYSYAPWVTSIAQHPVLSKCIPVGDCFDTSNDDIHSVLFMPTKRNQNIANGANNYAIGAQQTDIFRQIVTDCEDLGFSAIVFDTPAGNQATSQWALAYSKTIVTCLRITFQFRTGTEEFLRNRQNLTGKRFVIVPNAVPTEEIIINGKPVDYKVKKDNMLAEFRNIGNSNNNIIDLTMLGEGEDYFGINEVKRFKIQEEILFKIDNHMLSEDDKKAIEAYKRLAKCICEE